MNAWTNLRLATIQADLTARRAAVAAERAAVSARDAGTRTVPTVAAPRSDRGLAGWPVSSASRS